MPVKFDGKQLKKICFCKKEEYDFYEIEIPIKVLFSNKCKKFIYSELVKRHPCFSEDYCFDVKFCLKKKKIYGMVVVIHKFVLAKLHRENFDRCLHVSEIPNKKFFSSNKNGLIFLFMMLFTLLGSVLIFEKFSEQELYIQPVDRYEVKQEETIGYNKPLEKTMQLLFLVREKDCLVSCFSWETDGFYEKLSVSLENAYPEKFIDSFPDAKYSTVIYEEGIPLMQIDLGLSVYIEQNFNGNEPVFECRNEFRTLLLENGAFIKEESVTPYRVLFEFRDLNCLNNHLYDIFDFIIENELSIKRIRMESQGKSFFVDLEFSKVQLFNQIELCSFLKNGDFIFSMQKEQRINEIAEERVEISRTDIDQKELMHDEYLSLGLIRKSDGSFYEYYKDKLGKIEKRKVER